MTSVKTRNIPSRAYDEAKISIFLKFLFQKGNITMERIMNTLPDQDLMCAQMAVSFTLSNPPADEVTSYSSKIDQTMIFRW